MYFGQAQIEFVCHQVLTAKNLHSYNWTLKATELTM